jgi:iron complex outermembrane recepter protein
MRVPVFVSAMCLSLVAIGNTQSANADTDTGTQPSPTASNGGELAEVTVTAERREERLQNVPISMSVLGGGDLENSSFHGVSEALTAVPGVSVTQSYQGGGSNIAIRGVSAFPFSSGPSPVAYYLDSVPFGLIKEAIGPDADAYDLERVEVLRGPQGTLYGASALNGVVRILTHDPDLNQYDFKGRVADSSTDDGGNNYRADATVNVPIISDVLAVRATVGYQSNSGWIDQPNKNDANDESIGNYRIKVAAKPIEDLSIGLSAWSYRENAGGPNEGHAFDENSSSLNQPIHTSYDAYALKFAYQTPIAEISGVASYLDFNNHGTIGLDVPGFGIPGSLFFTQYKSNIASEEFNVRSTIDGPWRWSLGGMYRDGSENRFQTVSVLPVPAEDNRFASNSTAVYGEVTRLLLNGQVELTAGIRHFHDDIGQRGSLGGGPYTAASTTAQANTPRALVTWHVTDRLMTYASYSEGFRSGFPQDPITLLALPGFSAVKPDRLKNFEVGTKGTLWDGHLTYDAALYHMNWQDIQLQVFAVAFGVAEVPAIVNGASARGNGADLDFTLHFGSFTLSPYVSWNDLAVTSDVSGGGGGLLYHRGDRPSGSAETTAGTSAGYSVPLSIGELKFSASASYSSPLTYRSVQGPTLLAQEGNTFVDYRASAALDFATHWSAALYGDNLSNWRGTPAIMYPGRVPDYDLRVRPRTVGLQVEYRMH